MLGEGPGFSTLKSEWNLGPSQGRNQDGDKGGEERKHWRFWEKREREAEPQRLELCWDVDPWSSGTHILPVQKEQFRWHLPGKEGAA